MSLSDASATELQQNKQHSKKNFAIKHTLISLLIKTIRIIALMRANKE
jgi:hypothetical protein